MNVGNVLKLIRPSMLKQLDKCPGSAQMSAAHLERFGEAEEDQAATKGTLLHGIVARALTGSLEALDDILALNDWDRRCVNDALTFARALIEKHGIQPENVLVEHRLDGAELGLPNGGTADLILVVPFRMVVVIDWKFGFIDQEDADEHDQLVAYALMAARTFKCKTVEVYLFQPRASYAKRATGAVFGEAALATAERWVRSTSARALDPQAEVVAGYAQCLYCKAVTTCPAAKEYAMKVSEILADPIGPVTAEQWGELAARSKIATKIGKEASDLTKDHLEQGGSVAGWGLQSTGSTTQIDAAHAISEAKKAGKLDELLRFASFKAEAAEVLGDVIHPAVRKVDKAKSLKPVKGAA